MKCETATRLASDGRERSLTLREKSGLRGHLVICQACRRFQRNVEELGEMARYHRQLDDAQDDRDSSE